MVADYVSISQQHDFRFRIPDVDTQRAIARILGALDDKIELNRRMNETLEAMAQALFKSWFVNFDPVRAKAEGRRPGGMDDATAALFPDGFEESALGEIPGGWSTGPVHSLADVVYGAPFASARFNAQGQGLPLIRIRDLASHQPEVYTDELHPKATEIRPGDIVVGMDGEFRAHIWRGPLSLLNQRVCTFRPKRAVLRGFLALSLQAPLEFFERSKTGTTVIHLGKADIDTFSMLIPDPSVLGRFGDLVEPMVDKLVANAAESRTICAVRDALLPKLLSGEIRVRDAGKAVL
jgi:type I restriction enzyme S subunit